MSSPLVSVIIPTYCYAQYVPDAVESALAQTYSNLEVIVVDDGSTDATQEALRPYHGRIKYIFQHNQGAAAARNTGIQHARGEWIAFLDADDVWHREKVRMQMQSATGMQDVGLLGSPVSYYLPSVLTADPEVRILHVRDFLLSTPFAASSVVVRRTCFNEVGLFDTSLRNAEDRDMWLRLAARFTAVQISCPCLMYRCHSDQKSRHAKRMNLAYRAILSKFFREHPAHSDLQSPARSFMLLDSAIAHLAEHRRWRTVGFLLGSIWYNPAPSKGRAVRIRRKLLTRAVLGERLFHWLNARRAQRPTQQAPRCCIDSNLQI